MKTATMMIMVTMNRQLLTKAHSLQRSVSKTTGVSLGYSRIGGANMAENSHGKTEAVKIVTTMIGAEVIRGKKEARAEKQEAKVVEEEITEVETTIVKSPVPNAHT